MQIRNQKKKGTNAKNASHRKNLSSQKKGEHFERFI